MRALDKYRGQDKQLLRLERELDRLRRAQWRAPVVPLKHPYQRGWAKSYQLRPDAHHHPEAAIFRSVLPVINQRVVASNRAFVDRDGRVLILRPRIIRPGEWRRLAWSLRQQRLFAYGHWTEHEVLIGVTRPRRKYEIGFKLMRPWWLDEVIQPNLITHQRVDLPEVRSRIAGIEAFLQTNLGYERLRRLHGRSSRWRGEPASPEMQRALLSAREQGG